MGNVKIPAVKCKSFQGLTEAVVELVEIGTVENSHRVRRSRQKFEDCRKLDIEAD